MENGKCPESLIPQLKIKVKSLAAEARIIRAQERKMRGPKWGPSDVRAALYHHRTVDLRRESRASLIAYGFLRGRLYSQIEQPKQEPDWAKACQIAERFSGEDKRIVRQRFFAWAETADPASGKQSRPERKTMLDRILAKLG